MLAQRTLIQHRTIAAMRPPSPILSKEATRSTPFALSQVFNRVCQNPELANTEAGLGSPVTRQAVTHEGRLSE